MVGVAEQHLKFIEFTIAHLRQMRRSETANEKVSFFETAMLRLIEESLAAYASLVTHKNCNSLLSPT